MLTLPQKIYIKAGAAAGTDSSHVLYFLVEGEEVKSVAFSYLSGESQEFSGWFYGEGMKALGLHGAFFSKNSAQAKALLNGFHPETLKPLRAYQIPKPGSKQKGSVIAVELAVTGSKDLSLAQELAPPTEQGRLFAQCITVSQFKANQELLDAISWLCQARTGKAGSGPKVSGKPMFVVFPHRLTRESDMGQHFHNNLINSMECVDGKWRAIDLEPFFQKDTLLTLGQLYRDEEARFLNEEFAKHGFDLKAMSYEITNGNSYRLVNAKGEYIPEEVRGFFSKRSEQIDEKLAAEGITEPTPKQRRAASLATRGPKEIRGSVEDQQAQWRAQAAQLGFSLESFCPELTPAIAVESNRKQAFGQHDEALPGDLVPDVPEVPVTSDERRVRPKPTEEATAAHRKPEIAGASTSGKRDEVEVSSVEPEVWPNTSVKPLLPVPEPGVIVSRTLSLPPQDQQRREQRQRLKRDLVSASTNGFKAKELLQRMKSRVLGEVIHSFEHAMEEGKRTQQQQFRRLALRVLLAHFSGRKIRTSTFNRIVGNHFFPKETKTVQHPLLRKRAFWITELRFLTGQISLSTRIFHHLKQGHQVPSLGTPKTRMGIKFARALGRISRQQQLMLLLRNGHIHDKSPEIRVRMWPQHRTRKGTNHDWFSARTARARQSLLQGINRHQPSTPLVRGAVEQREQMPKRTRKHVRKWKL